MILYTENPEILVAISWKRRQKSHRNQDPLSQFMVTVLQALESALRRKVETGHDFPCSLHSNQEAPGKTSQCPAIEGWRDDTTHQMDISPLLRWYFLWEVWKRQITHQWLPQAPSKQIHGHCVSLGKASKWISGKSSHQICWGIPIVPAREGSVMAAFLEGFTCKVHRHGWSSWTV